MTRAFLNTIKAGAILGWHMYKILPSITGAQGVLEGASGTSKLAQPPYNNQFGIKAGGGWTGRTIWMQTYEHPQGYVMAEFRAYDSIDESVADHAAFFTNTEWRKNNYKAVVGEKDYKKAAWALQNAPAPYATDPQYANKLIRIIEQYGLKEWDQEAFSGGIVDTITGSDPKIVGKSLSRQALDAIRGIDITVIGDSLGVGTDPKMRAYNWAGYTSDNAGSRQWTHSQANLNALEILQNMLAESRVNKYVIFILGTNRGVEAHEIKQAADMLGSNRRIFLVDTASEVGHRTKVSNAYRTASQTYSNVYYVPWSDTARLNIAEWYHADGANGTRIHMNNTGYQKHAEFIAQAVYEASIGNTKPVEVVDRPIGQPVAGIVNINHIEYEDDDFRKPEGESVIYNDKLNDAFRFKAQNGDRLWIEHYLKVDSDDPEVIFAEGLKYMKERSKPEVVYTVDLESLPSTISIGDTGLFIDHEFNPPLYIEARILDLTTSDTDPSARKAVIGNAKELFAQEKPNIKAIQADLSDVREDMLGDYFDKYYATDYTIDTNNGTVLTEAKHNERLNDSTRLEIPRESSHYIYLHDYTDMQGDLYIKGRLVDNYEIDVDRFDPLELPDEPEIPVDPLTNPQGEPVPDDLTPDLHHLIVNNFIVELLDDTGTVVNMLEVPIYQTSEFNIPILDIDETVKIVRILTQSEPLIVEDLDVRLTDVMTSDMANTTLTIRPVMDDMEVPEANRTVYWRRITDDTRLDEGWNDKNKLHNENNITVYPTDLFDGKATFIGLLYAGDTLVGSAGIVITENIAGESAFETWKRVTNQPRATMEEYVEFQRGQDGEQGVPGESNYIHTAWATDPLGTNFSTSPFDGASWMGTATTEMQADPQDYSVYEWVYVKGEKGDTGETSYPHTAWADGLNGEGFTTEEALNKKYVGYYSSFDPDPPLDYTLYKWQRTAQDYADEFSEDLDSKSDKEEVNLILTNVSSNTEKINSLNTEINTTRDNLIITHSAEYIEKIEKTYSNANNLTEIVTVLEEVAKEVDTHFVFDDGFTIGRSDSKMKIRITNEMLSFMDGATIVSYISGTLFSAQNIEIQNTLSFPSHQIESSNGKLMFRPKGGA